LISHRTSELIIWAIAIVVVTLCLLGLILSAISPRFRSFLDRQDMKADAYRDEQYRKRLDPDGDGN